MGNAITTDDSGSTPWDLYDSQTRIDAEHERLVWDAVEQLADRIIEWPRSWNLLDGEGGWIAELLQHALERRGMASVWEPIKPRSEITRLAMRDGWECRYCAVRLGMDDDRERPTVDHVIPRSRGGSNDMTNKVLCCRSCNSRKSTRTPDEWISSEVQS